MSGEKITIEIEVLKQVFSDLNALKGSFSNVETVVQRMEKSVSGGMGDMHKALTGVSEDANKMAKAMNGIRPIDIGAIAASFTGLKDSLNQAVEPGIAFDKNLHDLSAMTGVTGSALDDLGERARGLAKTFGGDAASSVETMKILVGQLGPALASQPDAIEAMARQATLLSKTMDGDVAGAGAAITNVLNQYGVDVNNAAEATAAAARTANTLAAAANQGGAEVPALAAGVAQVGKLAKDSGVDIETLAASLEVLDAAGKKGAEGGVAMRNVLLTLGQATTMPEQQLNVLKAAGVDVKKLADNTISYTERLRMLKPLEKDVAALGMIFGTVNVSAASALVAHADDIDTITEGINKDTEALKNSAGTVMESFSERMGRWKAQMADFGITVFGATKNFLPFMNLAFDGVGILANLRNAQEGLSMVMNSKLGAALKGAVAWVGKLNILQKIGAAWTGIVTAAQWAWNAALTANPIGLMVAAVAALVGVVVYAWNHFEGFRAFLYGFWEAAKEVFSGIWEVVKAAFSGIVEMAKGLGGVLGGVWDMATGDWSKGWDKLKNGAAQFGKGMVDNLMAPAKAGAEAIRQSQGLGLRVGMAYAKGDAEGRASFRASREREGDEQQAVLPASYQPVVELKPLSNGLLPVVDGQAKPLSALDAVVRGGASFVDAALGDKGNKGKGRAGSEAGASVGGKGGGDRNIAMNITMNMQFGIGRDVQQSARDTAEQVVAMITNKLRDAQFALG